MMILRALKGLFAGGIGETVETVAGTFRENAERGAQRQHDFAVGAQEQFAAEFHGKGWFNHLMDGVNRVPRPAMAIAVIWLMALPAYDVVLFSEMMAAYALVPEAMWLLFGAIVTFYFGARFQAKSQQFAISKAQVQTVVENVKAIRELRAEDPGVAADESPEAQMVLIAETDNAAVAEWRGR